MIRRSARVAQVWRDLPPVLLALFLAAAFITSGVTDCAAEALERLEAEAPR